MAAIKINRQFKFRDHVQSDPSKSLYGQSLVYRLFMEAGGKTMSVPGKIGQGSKIHMFLVDYLDTPDGIGVCSVDSACGSAKWNSSIMPVFDDELEVNCKRCRR